MALAACAPAERRAAEDSGDDRLRVVASFSILEDLVREVGGDRVAVRTLVPRDGDPHTFEPTPREIRALTRASVVFEIGDDFEPWMDRLFRSSRSAGSRVALAGEVDLLPVAGYSVIGHRHGNGAPGEYDPHFWHDVRRTRSAVAAIRDALAEADPEHAAAYAENAERYGAELDELDAWILARVGTLAPERRKLFTHHDVFQYFARRYGFEVVGTALAAASTEVFDPAASRIRDQVHALRAGQVPAVFPETGSSERLIRRIAREADIRLAPPLYTGALSREDGEAPTYVRMMRYNVDTLVTHLGSDSHEL